MQTQKWYVLKTRPNAEKQALKQLSSLGITAYLPLQKQKRQWKDRNKWVEMVIFPSYLFAFLTENNRNAVFASPNISQYVFFDGKPALITEAEIKRIKHICAYERSITTETQDFGKGDIVEILDGHFCGLQGEVITGENDDKLKIYISGLQTNIVISIDKNIARKVIKGL